MKKPSKNVYETPSVTAFVLVVGVWMLRYEARSKASVSNRKSAQAEISRG